MIWESVGNFRHPDSQAVIAIQGIKPNARDAPTVVDIGAHVQLKKIGGAWNLGQKRSAHIVHKKGSYRDVGFFSESIHIQPGRKCFLEFLRIPFPMEEKKIVPCLEHHRVRIWLLLESATNFD